MCIYMCIAIKMREYIALPFADMHTSFPQAIESDMHLNRIPKTEEQENHYINMKEILMHNNKKYRKRRTSELRRLLAYVSHFRFRLAF